MSASRRVLPPLLVASILAACLAVPAPGATVAELRASIDAILARTAVQANTWSILIENLDGSVRYYERNPDTPRKPASNTKLFTTAACYELLGYNHVWNGQQLISAIVPINKDSDNELADELLQYLGQQRRGSATYSAGAAETLAWCSGTLGINMTGAAMNDGSGLSHNNRFTARQIVLLLRRMLTTYTAWDDSLSIGCVDGTLGGRFCGTLGSNRVHGKTGTLTGVVALSGYIQNDFDGEWYIFSFLANNVSDSAATRQAIDDCVILLGRAGMPPTPEFDGTIVDNADPAPAYGESGSWSASSTSGSWLGNARFATVAGAPATQVAAFAPTLPQAGRYRVYVWYTQGTNRSPGAAYSILHRDGTASVSHNQQANGATWMPLGDYDFNAGASARVLLRPAASNPAGSVVMADAVQFVYLGAPRAVVPQRSPGWVLR